MEYILCNFYTSDSATDVWLDSVFKTIGFAAKLKNKVTKQSQFLQVMIRRRDFVPDTEKENVLEFNKKHNVFNISNSNEKLLDCYSIYDTLLDNKNYQFTVDIISTINEEDFDVFYTDGSSSSKVGDAAYGTVKVLNESDSSNTYYDLLTNKNCLVEEYSGRIPNGTNNIGELTGLKVAIEHAGDKDIQVVVSDSEYTLKSFREWIYNWKNNGYKGSNKKQILNCELIKEIQNKLETSKKIYIFQWVKGHDDTPLNELCDRLAKNELGI